MIHNLEKKSLRVLFELFMSPQCIRLTKFYVLLIKTKVKSCNKRNTEKALQIPNTIISNSRMMNWSKEIIQKSNFLRH